MFGKNTGTWIAFAAAAAVAGSPAIAASGESDRVLFINSYHAGYDWADGVTEGVKSVLSDADVQLKTHSMDTKRNPSESFKKKAAKKAKSVIEDYNPDVVIASDDNASKYLIKPYYKNADLPFVFCGVNWDASTYGYPYDNVTGMVEVDGIKGLVSLMERITGETDDIGFIAGDATTTRKVTKNLEDVLGQDLTNRYAKDYADFKKKYRELQNETDFTIFYSFAAIDNWRPEDAKSFITENTSVPTGTFQTGTIPYVTMGYLKVPQEQGRWSAKTALKILDGTPVKDIPITQNDEGRLVLNSKMMEATAVDVPYSVIELADKVIE